MKERGIIMSAPMVKALLDGRKTQTRRIVKPQPEEFVTGGTFNWRGSLPFENMPLETILDACPYGVAGDQLWVRETWQCYEWLSDKKQGPVCYRSTHEGRCCKFALAHLWRPSIFMPRWASRITLEITLVRVERLHDISDEDAQAEGVPDRHNVFHSSIQSRIDNSHIRNYAVLWNSLHGKGAWELNPWVWVLEFEGYDGEG